MNEPLFEEILNAAAEATDSVKAASEAETFTNVRMELRKAIDSFHKAIELAQNQIDVMV